MARMLSTAAAVIAALADITSAAAVAVAARQQVAVPPWRPWITVDANGSPTTITPTTVTGIDGATSTVSPAPNYLTRTQTWLMTVDGTATTTTATAPVATATEASGSKAGAMLVCDNAVGDDKPFCVPKRGSLLNPGKTYYITWTPGYFSGNPDGNVTVQVNYDGGHGFTAPDIPVSQGFYIWPISQTLLETVGGKIAMNTTIFINHRPTAGDSNQIRISGPRITITKENMLLDDGLAHAPPFNHAMVAMPIIIVVVVLALLGFCVWSYRKRGVLPGAAAVAALKRRSMGAGQGYGVRRSRSERVRGGDGDDGGGGAYPHVQQSPSAAAAGARGGDRLPDDKIPGIQLTDRESWSPTSPSSGRNVFREEIQRQETGR